MPSVAPAVTSTSESGSKCCPWSRSLAVAIAARSSGTPGPGGYWFAPSAIARCAPASSEAGPSVSGKPWPRLIEPVRAASADISAKIVVVNGRSRSTSGSVSRPVERPVRNAGSIRHSYRATARPAAPVAAARVQAWDGSPLLWRQ